MPTLAIHFVKSEQKWYAENLNVHNAIWAFKGDGDACTESVKEFARDILDDDLGWEFAVDQYLELGAADEAAVVGRTLLYETNTFEFMGETIIESTGISLLEQLDAFAEQLLRLLYVDV